MSRPVWTPPVMGEVNEKTLEDHPPLMQAPPYVSHVLPPDASDAQKMEQLGKWMADMETWGKRVRKDICRLEVWLAHTRQKANLEPPFEWNDPGDPPPKPWG